jgi:hypothetical protein
LVVLRGMIPQAQAALANAELALLGRLDATEAELAARPLGLAPVQARLLRTVLTTATPHPR